MTNEITGWLGTANDMAKQLQEQSNIAVLLVPVIIIITCCIIAIPQVPGRLLFPLNVLMGAALNYKFGQVAESVKSSSNMEFILFAHGLIIGVAAGAVHVILARKLGRRFPALVGEGRRPTAEGDTVIIVKTKDKNDE